MQGAVLYGPRDVRFEEREVPKLPNRRMPLSASRRHASADRTFGRTAVSNRLLSPLQWDTSIAALLKRSVKRSRKSSPANSWSARLRPLTTLASSARTAINLRASDASS